MLDSKFWDWYVLCMKNLGEKIRDLRLRKGLTLAELSELSGVALSTLSRIETGIMTGTLESHIQIARILGARLPELYSGLDPLSSVVDRRKSSDTPQKVQSHKGALLSVLTSNSLHRKMLPALVHLPAGKSTRAEQTSEGIEKFIYALKGKTEITVGQEKMPLEPGDSVYFQASAPHMFRNTGSGEALLLSVVSPPSV